MNQRRTLLASLSELALVMLGALDVVLGKACLSRRRGICRHLRGGLPFSAWSAIKRA